MNLLSKPPSVVLGLTFDGGTLNAVELKRSNGSVHVVTQVTAPLTLDPLRDEAELVGREIRNILNEGRISARRCVAGVPAQWALTVHVKVPAMDPEDVASFLELEAERGFTCSVDELQTASKIYPGENGESYATIIGVPKAYLERLEAVLVAAQLKTVGLSIGILALPEVETGAITAEIADSRINLLLSGEQGVLALRTIEGAFDAEGAEKRVQGELLARELRITLGQLPTEIRENVRQLNIFGEPRFAEQLRTDLEARARNLDLRARHIPAYNEAHHGLRIVDHPAVSGAFSLAAQYLSDTEVQFEFLPPKPTVWEQISSKYSSRRLAYAGAAAGIVLLLLGSAFLYQQLQFSKYQDQWAAMESKVTELEDLQENARRFRPWNDSSFATMSIMRSVTEAFPEDGVVSAKIVEIRNGSVISCTGVARDNQSLLKTIDRLRGSPQVRDLRVDQIRGKAPLQFTFNFQWGAPTDDN
jgi:hypothetical protein